MKRLSLLIALALAGTVNAEEIKEFNKGDIATAADFNKNFKVLHKATQENKAAIEANRDDIAMLIDEVSQVNALAQANASFILVNSDGEKIANVLLARGRGGRIYTDDFMADLDGNYIESSFTDIKYLDSDCSEAVVSEQTFGLQRYLNLFGYVFTEINNSQVFVLNGSTETVSPNTLYHWVAEYDPEAETDIAYCRQIPHWDIESGYLKLTPISPPDFLTLRDDGYGYVIAPGHYIKAK
ncbi:hypothetical protein [Thalassotalea maritima]|uniref:hypothetical protein n=1 Tax=Thalassotalea maritima TaxID=3242416 RepID=UPI003527199A